MGPDSVCPQLLAPLANVVRLGLLDPPEIDAAGGYGMAKYSAKFSVNAQTE